jgi:hypothetical protein
VTPYSLVDIADVSEKYAASIFRVELFCTEDGDNRFLRNVGKYLPSHTMSHPKGP